MVNNSNVFPHSISQNIQVTRNGQLLSRKNLSCWNTASPCFSCWLHSWKIVQIVKLQCRKLRSCEKNEVRGTRAQNMIISKLVVSKHMVVDVECMAGGGDRRLEESGDVRLLFLLQQVMHLLVWCHDSFHLSLLAIHAQDPSHFSRVMMLAQEIFHTYWSTGCNDFFLVFICLDKMYHHFFTTLWCPTAEHFLDVIKTWGQQLVLKNLEKYGWSTLHMTQLYRQLLSETGRQTQFVVHYLHFYVSSTMNEWGTAWWKRVTMVQPWTFAL